MLFKKEFSKDLNTYNLFSLDSRLKKSLAVFAFCCQLISGFTEFLGIAPFLIDLLTPFLSPTLSMGIGNGLAIALALFLEFLIFYLIGFIIFAIKAKYLTMETDKIDRIYNRIKFWSATGLLMVLILVSAFLSKRNVTYQVQATPLKVEQIDLEQFDTKKRKEISLIEQRYSSDKSDLDRSMTDSKELVKNAFRAKINAIYQEIELLKRKEQRTGKSYRSRKAYHQKEIDQLISEEASELHQLRQKYDSNLQELKSRRDSEITAITDLIKSDRATASNKNQNSSIATTARNNWVSFILSWIASLSVFGFVVARSWVCMADATAGVKEKAMPLQEDYGSNFFKELYLLVRLSIQRNAQNFIRKKLATIPDLVPIENKGAIAKINAAKTHDETNNSKYLPNQYDQILKDSLNGYWDENHDLKNALYENRMAEKNEATVMIKNGYFKKCEYCQTEFTPNHKKHKFCCTKCRQKSWTKQNGRPVMLKKKKSK